MIKQVLLASVLGAALYVILLPMPEVDSPWKLKLLSLTMMAVGHESQPPTTTTTPALPRVTRPSSLLVKWGKPDRQPRKFQWVNPKRQMAIA